MWRSTLGPRASSAAGTSGAALDAGTSRTSRPCAAATTGAGTGPPSARGSPSPATEPRPSRRAASTTAGSPSARSRAASAMITVTGCSTGIPAPARRRTSRARPASSDPASSSRSSSSSRMAEADRVAISRSATAWASAIAAAAASPVRSSASPRAARPSVDSMSRAPTCCHRSQPADRVRSRTGRSGRPARASPRASSRSARRAASSGSGPARREARSQARASRASAMFAGDGAVVARDIPGNRRRESRHGRLVGFEGDQRREVGWRRRLHDLGSIGSSILPITVVALQRVGHETHHHGQSARTPSRARPEAART